jgi:mono/diheme cytochrome c family protein
MSRCMLFAGLGILIHTGVAAAGFSSGQVALPNRSEAAEVVSESTRVLVLGRTLFQERGCAACHEPELCGVGPSLDGLFGSAVQDQRRGVTIVDESYVREAILNPSATVALGYPPTMPTFAGQLTEAELQALIAYIKSLSVPIHVQRPKGVSP